MSFRIQTISMMFLLFQCPFILFPFSCDQPQWATPPFVVQGGGKISCSSASHWTFHTVLSSFAALVPAAHPGEFCPSPLVCRLYIMVLQQTILTLEGACDKGLYLTCVKFLLKVSLEF